MGRGGEAPAVVDVPRYGQQVMILSEVISCMWPETTLILVALGNVIAISISHEVTVCIVGKRLIKSVVSSQTAVKEEIVDGVRVGGRPAGGQAV